MLSLEVWDLVWRRNQFLARDFSKRGWDVGFIGPARDYSYAIRKRTLQLVRGGDEVPVKFAAIKATRPLKFAPDSLAAGRGLNDLFLRRHIKKLKKVKGTSNPVVWINNHHTISALKTIDRSCLIYDITDDWTQFRQPNAVRKRIIEADRWLCKNADAVIVCSESLYESRRKHMPAERLFLIQNGVDSEHYVACTHSDDAYPASTEIPVLGYTGTLHEERLDIDLIEALARELPNARLQFIGPNMLSDVAKDRLAGLGQIEFIGPVAYEELPSRMRQMDVLIVPHRVTPFTESLNPLKLWEYLATGKPIVATPVAGFRRYDGLVRIADSVESFSTAVRDSFSDPPFLREQRRRAVANHSWSARVDAVEKVIDFAISNARTSL